MQFTQIPPDYSPLDSGARYAFEADEAADRDFRIAEAGSGELLGAKRFRNAAAGYFDIAPYLRDRFRFEPGYGPTGFVGAAGRSVAATVETAGACAAARTFLRGTVQTTAPALRTSQPPVRLLGSNECDEITLVATGPCTASLTVRQGDTAVQTEFTDNGTGVRLFRLDAADFPGAEAFELAFEGIGRLEYRIVERPAEARRVAWIGRAGSIEHYTFPVVKSEEVRVAKRRIYGGEGYRTVRCEGERLLTLQSAYETPAAAEALAELLEAPQAWIVGSDGAYGGADVLADRAAYRRHGTLCSLEIAIRPTRKLRDRWN